MTISIRRAGSDDLRAIAPLFDAYRQFYAQPSDLQCAHDWLCERMRRDESVLLFAEREGCACGFTQLYRMFSSVRTARLWVLNDLFVAKDARRCGVARGLLDAAVQFARNDDAAGIMLETSRDNMPARALYTAAGWHEDASQWYSLPLAANSPR